MNIQTEAQRDKGLENTEKNLREIWSKVREVIFVLESQKKRKEG